LESKNYILFVFEGEKTEKDIFDSLRKYYLSENPNTIVYGVHCGEIYSLYHKLENDEDLDIFQILKEELADKNTILSNVERSDVSEVYLFFDYDGHASAASDDKLRDMLELFENETEHGKLYISYPMVEALKHLGNKVDYKNLIVDAKNNIKYKNLVSTENDTKYKNIVTYSENTWEKFIECNGKKLGVLFSGNYEPLLETKEPIEIFEKQLEKHIRPSGKVAVLSAFPIFLIDYYGYTKFFK